MQINGSGNVYEQIVGYYRRYITMGILPPGEKMPSCRELAVRIGVNHKTVERAYGELEKEGLIEGIPKKGFFVAKGRTKENPLVSEVIMQLKNEGISKEEILDAVERIFKEKSL